MNDLWKEMAERSKHLPKPTPEQRADAERRSKLAEERGRVVDALYVKAAVEGREVEEVYEAHVAAGRPDPDSGHEFWRELEQAAETKPTEE